MSTFIERRILARQENWKHPGYSWCQRCNLNWGMTTGHNTIFLENETGKIGVFALCVDCWQECSIEERLVYYRLLWDEYALESSDEEKDWPLVEQAVRAGN